MSLKKQIIEAEHTYLNALHVVQTQADLEELRLRYLGRHGIIAVFMEQLKALTLDDRREYGPLLNALKASVQAAHESRMHTLIEEEANVRLKAEANFDVTAYIKDQESGNLHIYTQVSEYLEDIFISMGYQVVDGPEVEEEFYNFDALNIPTHHPARDMQDTFWLNIPGLLMRTHTSNVQVRQMKKQTPPMALYSSGRAFRNEATDASHDFMFRQGEVLFIDENVSMAHLLATAQAFLKAIFSNENIKIRVRPSYFPFVEPGIEIDASCPFCSFGCSVCKKSGWIELLGAGLIHPKVLQHGGIDSEKYSGFAMGFGIIRIAMLRHGINDVRLFSGNNVHFLTQF